MSTDSIATERTARLADFVAAWSSLTHRPMLDANRLAVFLDAARDRLRPPPPMVPVVPKLDPSALEPKLAELSAALKDARSVGFGFNPWAVAGLRRNEVRVCAALKTLWNPAECGDSAVGFLHAFLHPLENGELLPNKEELKEGYVVRTEHNLLGDLATRMDITIEGRRFAMVIEVKIGAREGKGDGETKQYDLILEKTKAWATAHTKKRSIVVLLSPGRQPQGFKGIHADWSAVSRAAHLYMRKKGAKRSTYSFYDHLLAGFAHHVTSF